VLAAGCTSGLQKTAKTGESKGLCRLLALRS